MDPHINLLGLDIDVRAPHNLSFKVRDISHRSIYIYIYIYGVVPTT